MLSIIITHYKTPTLLKLCLKSITENTKDIEHEVVVIDCEFDRAIQESLKDKFPDIKFISFKNNVGYAKLVNVGIKTVQGDYLLILNADILVGKDSLSFLLKFIKDNPRVGMIGPQLLGFDNSVQESCFRYPNVGIVLARRTFLAKTSWGKKKLKSFLYKDKDLSSPQRVDWIQGSAMFCSKEAADKVGPMDERFFMYLEDTDWCRRFWKNNYEVVYLPNSKMFHYHGRHSKKRSNFVSDVLFNKYGWIHIISLLKFLWKWR